MIWKYRTLINYGWILKSMNWNVSRTIHNYLLVIFQVDDIEVHIIWWYDAFSSIYVWN